MRFLLLGLAAVTAVGMFAAQRGSPVSIVRQMDEGMVYIAHRGAAIRAPEGTNSAYAYAIQHTQWIEQDTRENADGSLVVTHDASAAYLTSSSANYSALSDADVDALTVDSFTAFGVTYPRVKVQLFRDVLARYRGHAIFVVETKDTNGPLVVSDLQAANVPTSQGLVASFTVGDLAAATGAGYFTQLVGASTTILAAAQSNSIKSICYDHETAADALFTAAVAAGMPVFAYTVERRKDRDRLAALGVSGVYTNDPEYLRAAAPFSTADNFAAQAWQPGMIASLAVGSDMNRPATNRRGQFYSPDQWGYEDSGITTYRGALMGHMSPVGGVAANDDFTLNFKVTFGAPSDANQARWASVAIAATDQAFLDDTNGTPNPNSYHFLLRKNGTIGIYKRDGTAGTLLVQDTSGPAIADDAEHEFNIIVTPTDLTIQRLDGGGSVIQTVTSSDVSTGYRGGYFHLGHSMLPVKFRDVTIL